MEAIIYNAQGKKTGTIALPERIFGVPWNDSLMHQVVTSMQDNARTPTAHVKGRGEVRGGGRKPWRQKGTGRARHGSIRSPIWKGGGKAHGPHKETQFARAIPKKMRAKALLIALSRKYKDGEIIFVDSMDFAEPKTAKAVRVLRAVGKAAGARILSGEGRPQSALVAFPEISSAAKKSTSNISCVGTKAVRDLNPLAVLKNKYLIIENPHAAIAILENRIPAKPQAVAR